MQRPKQEGLGAAFGGGMTDQAFGARTTDVLQKGTVYLASLLFIVTLALSILVGTKSNNASIALEIESNKGSAIEEHGDAAAQAAALAGDDAGGLAAAVEEAIGEAAVEVSPATEVPVVPEAPVSE